MFRLESVSEGPFRCAEAPVWDGANQRLLWLDISVGTLHAWAPDNDSGFTMPTGVPASAVAFNRSGGLILGGESGLVLWRNPSDYRVIASHHEGEQLSINDIAADSEGRIYAGTLFWGENGIEKPGKLHLIENGKQPRVVDDGIQLANGLGFSPDDRTLYFADSAARVIYAYDVAPRSGSLSSKRALTRIPAEDGIPDGLTVDSEGFVWCAMWYGAQVIRLDPDGTIERRIPLPVAQVSSVAFGGRDLTTLYITTAAEPWPSPLEPPGFDWNARSPGGSLYGFATEIRGQPERLGNF